MVRFEKVRFSDSTNGVIDIQVSTAGELPVAGTVIGGYKIQAGSIAQIIQSGKFATLDENGKWYDQTGAEVEA